MSQKITNHPIFLFLYEKQPTIVYKDWVSIEDDIFHVDELDYAYNEHQVPKEYQDKIASALAGEVEPFDLNNFDQLEGILKTSISRFAYYFILNAHADNLMYQIILDAKDPKWACMYCNNIENNADMRQIILDAKDPQWAIKYCEHFGKESNMRQIVVDSNNPKQAFNYCARVAVDSEIRQIIIDSGDPKWAYLYLDRISRNVDKELDMRQVIVDSGDLDLISSYCRYIDKNDAKMLEIIKQNDET